MNGLIKKTLKRGTEKGGKRGSVPYKYKGRMEWSNGNSITEKKEKKREKW